MYDCVFIMYGMYIIAQYFPLCTQVLVAGGSRLMVSYPVCSIHLEFLFVVACAHVDNTFMCVTWFKVQSSLPFTEVIC